MILDAYIPIDRRQALASEQPLPIESNGAALFADISGFTKFTSELTRKLGVPRGADEITRYLNLVYDPLISQIHQYRGAVIRLSNHYFMIR